MQIGIAGVGGIGSNVACMLVRSGLPFLKIIDFDVVDEGNLNRQFYFADQVGMQKVTALSENLRRINAQVELAAISARLHPENIVTLFVDCQLVVEGFDRQEEKKMLLESLGASKKIVSACGIAGADLHNIHERRIANCQIVGDFQTDCADAPLFAHKVMAIAAQMSALVIEQWRNDR